jgi:hypothetical protein
MNNHVGVKLILINFFCLTITQQASIQLKLENNTPVKLQVTFTSAVYNRPQVTTVPAGRTGKFWLDDLTDKDITKDTTVEVIGTKLQPRSWTFRQIDLINNMKLIFSVTEDNMLTLTVEKPSGATFIHQPNDSEAH